MHNFISYSSVDAADFAIKLSDTLSAGPPETQPWIDKKNLHMGDWDTQINNAIRSCESLIFVMTRDSIEDNSICKNEWTRALKYKKPIFPVLLHPDAELPFRLGSRNYIDFSVDFETGFKKLKDDLQWLHTPEGQLQSFKSRLSDAERDLRRADRADYAGKIRVKKEIEELTVEIKRLESIIQSPITSAAQSQQSIKARIEIERQPPPHVEIEKHAKFINPPPMSAPSYFQDRFVETGIIADFLKTDSFRMITLVGRGGIGKTAMVCRLLKSLERELLPDDRGEFEVGGIVYLNQIGTHQIMYSNLFEDLCRLLPPDVANHYIQIYKDGQRSVHSKMLSLLEEFQTEPVVVLLDNLETFIDPETRSLMPEDLKDALRALLEAPHHTVKVIITTRIPPQDLLLIQPERHKILPLDDGLGSPHAENLLRALDSDGILGLRDAPDTILNKIRENTRGFPRALEAFYGVLAADRSTTLEELLSETQNALPQYVVEKLVGEAFSRLDKNAQMVIQALAIFGRPVPSVAVDFLLQSYIRTPDSARILNNLVNMYFVRREQGRYYLHPVDLAYAISLVPPESKSLEGTAPFSQRSLRKHASEYFHQTRRPREEWKKLADIEPQLAEFDLRCAVDDYETAFWLVNEIQDDYLILWGHAGLVVEMRQKLLGKLIDDRSICRNLTSLGSTYLNLGNSRKVIEHCTQALYLSEKINDQVHIALNLNSLAIAYRRLGQISKAIEMYERSLIIDRNLSRTRSEATELGNLGVAYRYLGQLSKSINFHEQSLAIQRRNLDIRNEGWSLGIQSVSFRYLGQIQKAIESSTKALKIARDEKDRYWEAYHLAELGSSYLDLGNVSKGSESLEMALKIAQETADSHFEAVWAVRLGVKDLLFGYLEDAIDVFKRTAKLTDGNENSQYDVDFRLASAMAELRSERLELALNIIEPALQTEYHLNLPEIMALKGIVLLRQKKLNEAATQFTATIAQADILLQQTAQFYSALEAKGVAACGLAVCEKRDETQYLALAIMCYHEARAIVMAEGVVKRALFFFDECAKADDRSILSNVRNVVEGKNYVKELRNGS